LPLFMAVFAPWSLPSARKVCSFLLDCLSPPAPDDDIQHHESQNPSYDTNDCYVVHFEPPWFFKSSGL
jgi:hypothetical protein